jgi:hypothetical protein
MALHLRPNFTVKVPHDSEVVATELERVLSRPDLEVRWSRPAGGAHRKHFDRLHVLIAPKQRKFWSPWLNLDLHADATGVEAFGRFSPHPSVWTGFAAAYLLLGTIGFFAAIFGMSQWMVGTLPWALLGTLGCAAVAALMGWASQVGQRLARAEMTQLRAILAEALHETDAAPALPLVDAMGPS